MSGQAAREAAQVDVIPVLMLADLSDDVSMPRKLRGVFGLCVFFPLVLCSSVNTLLLVRCSCDLPHDM